MKKIILKTFTGLILLSGTVYANQSSTSDMVQVLKKYEKNGLHSEKDFEKYKDIFNKYITKKTRNKKLDEITVLKKIDIKGKTFEIYKEIDNEKAAKKIISKTVSKNIKDDKKIKKYIYYISKNLINWDAASICSKLDKMNFFKYGGKFKEIVVDKINNNTLKVIITNSKECKKAKKRFEQSIKKFMKFMKNDIKNNN